LIDDESDDKMKNNTTKRIFVKLIKTFFSKHNKDNYGNFEFRMGKR
jgi:hypothetical protein